MLIFAKTDIGKAREMNQDCLYIPKSEEDLNLYIVADGMGGYKGGEIASNLAIASSRNYIENNFADIKKDRESIIKLIQDAIIYANMVVCEKAKEEPELENMGTTLEICLIYGNKMYIGHVGDSRIYRIRKNIIRKLTRDHSYVEKLINDGTITREEAQNHPKKNMLLKAVGISAFIEPDVTVKGFLKDDIILIATDGLTNMVPDEQIYKIIQENINKDIAKKLVEEANNQGGYDNITAVVIYNN